MPRLPVDGKKVVEHRITFGTKERDMMESALGAFQFNRVATPIVAGMSDVSFMVVVAGILAIYFPKITVPGQPDTMDEVINAIYEGVANADPDPDRPTLGDPEAQGSLLNQIWFNLTNPNWASGAPGFREAWRDAFD